LAGFVNGCNKINCAESDTAGKNLTDIIQNIASVKTLISTMIIITLSFSSIFYSVYLAFGRAKETGKRLMEICLKK